MSRYLTLDTRCVSKGPQRDKEIYYKDLAHETMEAEKSKKFQLASWRPRRADVQF